MCYPGDCNNAAANVGGSAVAGTSPSHPAASGNPNIPIQPSWVDVVKKSYTCADNRFSLRAPLAEGGRTLRFPIFPHCGAAWICFVGIVVAMCVCCAGARADRLTGDHMGLKDAVASSDAIDFKLYGRRRRCSWL
jgi:hypothetical protein